MTKPYIPNKETSPFTFEIREFCNGRQVDMTFSQTQILNKFIELLEFREKENAFNDVISKDAYIISAKDFITNILLIP